MHDSILVAEIKEDPGKNIPKVKQEYEKQAFNYEII